MAVIQISKIQVRRGYQEDIPQLASGELGWSIDERRLFIGNGTLTEGAPEIGNTEILTIYSPIGAALANIGVIESNISTLQTQVAALQANSTTTVSNVTLADNNAIISNANIIFSTTRNILDYSIVRGLNNRVGTLSVTQINGLVVYQDDYNETGNLALTLDVTAYGNTAVIQYTTISTGNIATLYYYNQRTFA